MRHALLSLLLVSACEPGPLSPDWLYGTGPAAEPEAPKPEGPKVNEGTVPMPDATRAEVCADDCLLLTRYDVHTVKHRFDSLCCGPDGVPGDPRCGKPWPFEATESCEGWTRLEKCVYARYGYEFKPGSRWAEEFAKEPWYQPSEYFQAGDMSITAKRNTLSLQQFASSNADCKPGRRRGR
ncbi:MAG: hypothetical protein AB8H79_13340 [Myxococcota bacterium]